MTRLAVLVLVACGGSQSVPPPPPIATSSDAGVADTAPDAAASDTPPPPINQAEIQAASRAFVDLVQGSRLNIQRCYERALKLNAAPQNQAVTLTVVAEFANGKNVKLTSEPALGAPFEPCLQAIATRWQLAGSLTITFKAQLTLTPGP
jgi:hypothetical protein